MKISVVGKISSGKSSFINSFYNEINPSINKPIASVSLLRETLNPIIYNLEKTKKFDKIIEETGKQEDGFIFYKKYFCSSKQFKLIDFPGFDDAEDNRDFLKLIAENMSDLTIFVTDAYTAFLQKSELEYFAKIKNISNNLNKCGYYNKLIVLVNKYDFVEDEDLGKIFEKIPKRKFRICSYANFKRLEIKDKLKARATSAPFDIDGFMAFLTEFEKNLPKNKRAAQFNYLGFQLKEKPIAQIESKWDKNFLKNLNKYECLADLIFENFLKFNKIIAFPPEFFNEDLLKKHYENFEFELYAFRPQKCYYREGNYMIKNNSYEYELMKNAYNSRATVTHKKIKPNLVNLRFLKYSLKTKDTDLTFCFNYLNEGQGPYNKVESNYLTLYKGIFQIAEPKDLYHFRYFIFFFFDQLDLKSDWANEVHFWRTRKHWELIESGRKDFKTPNFPIIFAKKFNLPLNDFVEYGYKHLKDKFGGVQLLNLLV